MEGLRVFAKIYFPYGVFPVCVFGLMQTRIFFLIKPTMGTVHTLSATSAEESFEQLQTCMRGANSYGIVVPQAHFLEQFLRFYPEFPREHLYTPSSLLNACGLKPVPPEIALLSEKFNEFADPSFVEFEEKHFDAWLKQQSYVSWNFDLEIQPPFERCILFGLFSRKQQQYLVSALKCCEFFILQRMFRQMKANTSAKVYHYPHRNVADSYAWIERMKVQHPKNCGILLPTTEPLMTLFRKPPPKRALARADWQEEGTVGGFLAYAQTQTDPETFQTWQRDCDEAFRDCLTEDFNVLREHLLRNGKIWIEPFVRHDFPASASVGDYVTLIKNAHPPLEFSNLSILQTCPLVVTKRAFFSYLRRLLRHHSGFETDVLRWDEAAFLPIKEGFVPQAVATGSARDADILSWMTEVASRGGSLHLGVPLRDRNGEPLQALAEKQTHSELIVAEALLSAGRSVSKERSPETRTNNHSAQTIETTTDGRTYITVSNALSVAAGTFEQRPKVNVLRFPEHIRDEKTVPPDVQTHSQTKDILRIPTEFIHFSCKNWERFYRCPRKTWLEKILKTVSVSFHPTVSKALFLGESIHDNLIFSRQPRDWNAWETLIRQRSDARWQRLCQCNGSKNISLLRQWHQRALEYSLTMAEACGEFLHDGWKLYSEYVLPKENSYTGRIDLLAVHQGKQKIAVIDYKSGLNETLTPRTLKSGYGWQLLLYGQAMQTLYPMYAVELRMVLRTGEAKILRSNEVDEAVSEMNAWIAAFQQSGLYEALPDEKAETLPLAFVNGKRSRF